MREIYDINVRIMPGIGWTMMGMLLCFALVTAADAYTLNYAKPSNSTIRAVVPIPPSLMLNASAIDWLVGLHAHDGAAAYQAGYDDAVRDVLARFGIKKPASNGSARSAVPPSREQTMICHPTYAGFWTLNVSSRLVEGSFNVTVRPAPGNRTVNRTMLFKEVTFNAPLKVWLR